MEYVLMHHGIKGQRWGIRRFQNRDGTLTMEGKIHYRKRFINPRRSAELAIRSIVGNLTGHYKRNQYNTDLPINDADAEKRGWVKLSAKKSAMHQNVKTDGVLNSKWISPDGHKEVVFTGKGANQRITKDPRDEGTYNFFNPNVNPFKHTVYDVIPYIFLGNESNDVTTMDFRIGSSIVNFMKKPVDDISDEVVINGEIAINKMKERNQ